MSDNPVKSIHLSITKGQNDAIYVELLGFEQHRFRIQIRSNSYKDQCWAMIERHDGSRWQELWSLHSSAMATEVGLHYRDTGIAATNFRIDRSTLLARALDILQVRR